MQTHWQSDKDRLLHPAPNERMSLVRRVFPLPTLHRTVFTLFVIALPAVFWLRRVQPDACWPIAILLLLAFGTTVVSQCRTLPAQNVLVATLLITVIAGILLAVGATASIPFGPFNYTDAAGDRMFGTLPWMLPLLWVVVILNCRGVARLMLRPWRKVHTYGFRVIGLTCVLAMFFDLGLEPFATRANRFWVWQPTNFSSTWFGAPWINCFGWLVAALLILAFATPWLINKRPVQHPPDYHPLGVWLLLNLFFAVQLLLHALWPAAVLVLLESAVVTTLALSYARW